MHASGDSRAAEDEMSRGAPMRSQDAWGWDAIKGEGAVSGQGSARKQAKCSGGTKGVG